MAAKDDCLPFIRTDRGPAVNLASLPQLLPTRELIARLRAKGVPIIRIARVGAFVPAVELLRRCIDAEN